MRFQHVAFALTTLLSSNLLLLAACGNSSSNNSPDAAGGQDTGVVGQDGAVGSDAPTGSDASGGQDGQGGDTGTPADAGAPGVLAFPKVISEGEPQMTSPKVVTITFSGDTMATQLAAFGAGVTQSPWWSTIIADYCPADAGGCMGQAGVSDAVATAAGASYVDTASGDPTQLPDGGVPIWNVLTTEIAAAHVPPPDLNTLYMIYLPGTTSINLDGAMGCNDFDGYHNQTTYTAGGTTVPVIYGIASECPNYALSDVTLTASHEIAEAATDGYTVGMNSGYYLDLNDPNTVGWNDLGGGEVGDLCVDFLGVGQDHTPEGVYTAQRIWSISQANLLKDPCIPVPSGTVYFNAFPEKAFFIMNVGDTRTVTVTGFSDATHADWFVTALDETDPTTKYLQLTLPTGATTNNGKTMQMTMKLLADPTTATFNGDADGVLVSTDIANPMNAMHGNYWPFAVMTPAGAMQQGYTEPSHLHKKGPHVHKMSPHARR